MKFAVLALLFVAAVFAEDLTLGEDIPIARHYHDSVGVPAAARIKAAEEGTDFDGSRIFGGSPATLGTHPHMGGLVITLTDGRTSVCGSSLLSNARSITAAHCWFDGSNQASQFVVVLGSTTLFTGGTRVTTSSVVLHFGWTTWNLNNDVAIINLSFVNLNANIQPIGLPIGMTGNTFAGTWAWAAGFGATGANTGVSSTLNQAQLQVITNAVCAQTYGGAVVIASTICCSGQGSSTCGGDSGGPLWIWSGTNRILIGVTSFGHVQGCHVGHHVGFARVTSFIPWIQGLL